METYQSLIEAAEALLKPYSDGNIPENIESQANALLARADVIKASLNTKSATSPVFNGFRRSAPNEGNTFVDSASWRDLEVKGAKVRYWVPECVTGRDYESSFQAYLQKGESKDGQVNIGPNDKKSLSVGVDSTGGFFVPPSLIEETIKKQVGSVAFRRAGRVMTVGGNYGRWVRVKYTANDQYSSGARMQWIGPETPVSSAAIRFATEPTFGLLTCPIHTAMASMFVSNVMLEDTIDPAVLAELVSDPFIVGENVAFATGNGLTQPQGILWNADDTDTSKGIQSVVSGAAAALTADGLVNFAFSTPSQYFSPNAACVMNQRTWLAGRKLTKDSCFYDAQGNPRLEHLPVLYDDFMPDVSAGNFVAVSGDLHGFVVFDRVGLSIRALRELYAEQDLTLLLARKRVGSMVCEPWKMKLLKVSA